MFDTVRLRSLLRGQNDSRVSLINKKESSSTPNVKNKVKYLQWREEWFWGALVQGNQKRQAYVLHVLWEPRFIERSLSPSFISKRNGFPQRIQLGVDVRISTDKHVPTQLSSVFKTFCVSIFDYCKSVHLIPTILLKKRKVIPSSRPNYKKVKWLAVIYKYLQ